MTPLIFIGVQDEENEDGRREREARITNFHYFVKTVTANGCTHIIHNVQWI